MMKLYNLSSLDRKSGLKRWWVEPLNESTIHKRTAITSCVKWEIMTVSNFYATLG